MTSALPGGSGTILVADDDKSIREVTGKLLEMAGYTVLLAGDSWSAVETLRENAAVVRLVLLDLCMPGGEGAETYDLLREIVPEIPILVMTGYPEAETRRQLGGREVAALIEKPFQPLVLFQILHDILENRS